MGSILAELTKTARRPATWLLVAIAVVLELTFAYLVPYAGAVDGEREAASRAPGAGAGISVTLPDRLVGNALSGTPVFVGALALILGVLVVGSEYGWGTWKTVLGQGPGRSDVYVAKLVAVAAGALAVTVSLFAVGALAGAGIAAVEGRTTGWPGPADLITGLGAGWLVTGMWAALGVLLATALRGVALPIGIGLVWLLAVQNLVAGIAAPLLDWVADLQTWLPGPNAGSLVASLGADPTTPGVGEVAGAGQSGLVLGCYTVAFALIGGWLFLGRDLVE
ncbi:hypothetical protein SUDANB6_05725 [Streptomyces sp. enrichment culture]|uniref:ABC transporter permease subunit n=1 Tax=Streptomyces sp. enrichment culture TaxID=1795815 RepID=UPI003F570E29